MPEVVGLIPTGGWPDRALFLTYTVWVVMPADPGPRHQAIIGRTRRFSARPRLEPAGPADADRPPNLDVHIDQVAEVVERSGGTPLALCGHSYAGLVIAGVADRLGDRIDQLVFIDPLGLAAVLDAVAPVDR